MPTTLLEFGGEHKEISNEFELLWCGKILSEKGSKPLLPNNADWNGIAVNSYDQWHLWSSLCINELQDFIVWTYKTT